MAKSILVTIDKNGGVNIEAKGYKGKGCQEATSQIEAALGKVTDTKRTPEAYERPEEQRERNRY